MKKVIMSIRGKLYFLIFAKALHSCEGYGSSSPKSSSSGGETSSPSTSIGAHTTRADYQISLDDNKKVKKEGNKVYYEIPCGTEVKITAEVKGTQPVRVKWMQTPSNVQGVRIIGGGGLNQEFHYHKTTENGSVTSEESSQETEYIWMFASGKPMSITVTGELSSMDQNKKDDIVHNQKIFVITWK
jgi:hypothetical protein